MSVPLAAEKDDLLLDLAKNPIFNEMPAKKDKIRIDKRFQQMLTDKRFDDRGFHVDKRGKPVRGQGKNFAKRIYEMSEESEESDEKQDDKEESNEFEDVKEDKNLTKRKITKECDINDGEKTEDETENDKEESDQEEVDDVSNESSEDDELPNISLDLARGEAPDIDSSSGEDDNEEDQSEISGEEKNDPDLEDGVRRVEWASSRLAVCNMDWSKISAEALMIVCFYFLL